MKNELQFPEQAPIQDKTANSKDVIDWKIKKRITGPGAGTEDKNPKTKKSHQEMQLHQTEQRRVNNRFHQFEHIRNQLRDSEQSRKSKKGKFQRFHHIKAQSKEEWTVENNQTNTNTIKNQTREKSIEWVNKSEKLRMNLSGS